MSCKVSDLLMIDIKYSLQWSKYLIENYATMLENHYKSVDYNPVVNERQFISELENVLKRIDVVLYEGDDL